MQDVKCKELSFSTHNSQVDIEKKERREKKIESRRSKTRTTALSCSLSKPKSLSFRRATTCSFTENGVDKVAKVKRHLMSKGQKQTTWTVIGNICVRLLVFLSRFRARHEICCWTENSCFNELQLRFAVLSLLSRMQHNCGKFSIFFPPPLWLWQIWDHVFCSLFRALFCRA